MKLIIAEKAQLANAIADAIPGTGEKKNGTIIKGDYVIIWCAGHLLCLKDPQDYDERYAQWRIEDLPIYFEPWEKKIAPSKEGFMNKEARVRQIGSLMRQADMVINAGDNDEEGSLLINELLEWFNYKGPAYRLDTADTSPAAMSKALQHLKPNSTCIPDAQSAHGRELADIVFGYNPTRYFSVLYGQKLTFGRVQVPLLGLVVNRDRLIEGHVKQKYYELEAYCSTGNGLQFKSVMVPNKNNPALEDGHFLTPDYPKSKGDKINGAIVNFSVSRGKTEKKPELPFDLAALTVYCEKNFGYTPDEVMSITQSLRENYRAITYNRSDCRYLTEELFKEAPNTVAIVVRNLGLDPTNYDTTIHSDCFNDKYVEVHYAIIPTAASVDIGKMKDRERNVYIAICNYYLAQFMPPAIYGKVVAVADIGDGDVLKANASKLLSPGWLKQVLSSLEKAAAPNGETALFKMAAGEHPCHIDDYQVVEKETQPPPRYTQATLYKDSTCIAKYVDDPEVKRILQEKDKDKKSENGSIGTSATRSVIIAKLLNVGFLETITVKKKECIRSTAKGRAYYDVLPDEIKKADTTAKWWLIQQDIKKGKATPEDLARSVLQTVKQYVLDAEHEVNPALASAGQPKEPVGKCPVCGGVVREWKDGFSCANKDFTLFKKMKRFDDTIPLTRKKAQDLLSGKPIQANLTSKAGKKYTGLLKLDGVRTVNGRNYPNLVLDGFVDKPRSPKKERAKNLRK